MPNTFSYLLTREDLPKYGDGNEYFDDFIFSNHMMASSLLNKENKARDQHIMRQLVKSK
jgi:hypothetical protein